MIYNARNFLFSCVLLLFIGAAVIAPVSGTQYTVAPTGAEFTSIQDAVTWASPLDTITVKSGTYPESVRINKAVVLIGVDSGSGAPVIDPGKRGSAFEVVADGCNIKGFTLQNSETMSGVLVTSNSNTIENNTIRANSAGISLVSATGNTITGNTITDSRNAGIVLENAKNNRIDGNRVLKNALGITLDEKSTANTITFNTFSNTENVRSKSAGLQWQSSTDMNYQYLGKTFVYRIGNYWSDYRGTDSNSDGIGDTPYVVGTAANHNIEDPAPLMDPVEYYSQIQPAASGSISITPQISVSPGSTAPGTHELSGNGEPVPVPDNSGSPQTGLLVLVILAVVAVVGGLLVVKSRKKPVVLSQGGTTSSLETRPLSIPDQPTEEKKGKDVPAVISQPSGSGSDSKIPALETEVIPAPVETPPAPTQKYYFPPELESKYSDIRHIGTGGVAHVFAAHRKTDNRLVAVKIPISFDEVTGKCFLNEIAAWQTLRHTNIVEVLEVNILPVPYVEMEYVPGSLEAVKKPLPVWKAVHLVHGIADGLAYAHAHGIIHRDIKPHNILVTGDFIPKITDWGMSKVIATTMQKSSVAGFSLSYAAPEQVSPAEFGRTDVRTDIYQLGALFYELVTGSIPFGGESIVEVGNAIVREEPTLPTEYNPDAEAVEKIILKCLEKKPDDRYQTADELLDALSRYLDEDDK
ncbi:MAG TPA: NosD domain-containing protein [Methanoregula sp.]|nr:NosD domain-containing protein [Methanoregula sp.]